MWLLQGFGGIFLLGVVMSLSSCRNDDISDESYYTFTGETLGQYLENRPEEYSKFNALLKRCKLKTEGSTLNALLDAYGSFTCFAPNNRAMDKYLKRYNLSSVDQMTDSAVQVIARMHVVNSVTSTVYESKNFTSKLPDQNMYNKTVYIKNDGESYLVNQTGRIVERDLLVHNGVIQQIDSVLEPSDLQLNDYLKQYPKYSLFREATELTNIGIRLNTEPEDRTFVPAVQYTDIGGGTAVITPQNRYFYYTCFIETNDVFAKAGIHSLEEMKAYAKNWFESAYSRDSEALQAGLTENWEDENNYFNRFVAYHFVNKKIDREAFRYGTKMVENSYDKYQEFAETLAPNQMLYMAAGKNSAADDANADRLQLNPSASQVAIPGMADDLGWTRSAQNGVLLSVDEVPGSSNGVFHEIESVLTYPRSEFGKIRFRFDMSSLFPEIMDNDIRAKFTNGQQVYFPADYLSNVWFRSAGTRFYYLNPQHSASNSWNNYQGDEMMALGNFDFDVKLPGVPAGQYEIRYGYTANSSRGCAQIYMGTSRDNMKPYSIPVDLTQDPANYGWVADTKTDQDYENDKLLHANGWMKGPNSTKGANGNSSLSLRGVKEAIRCIVGTVTLEHDGSVYLRFRNATTNESAQFMMDYLEICPANIYDNPLQSESRD